jgi:hypothetical protein
MTVRFDEAWSNALAVARSVSDSGVDVVLIRDILGRVAILVDNHEPGQVESFDIGQLGQQLSESAGAFAAPAPAMSSSDLFDPTHLLDSNELITLRSRSGSRGRLRILERSVVGGQWTRIRNVGPSHRVTLYGFKGGVGRSTAAFMLAQHIASTGRCALVVDLDLESPGVGALLQDEHDLPDFGLVDHLVEHAVGNSAGLDLVVRSQAVRTSRNGEVWLAPAGGRPRSGYDYIAKLNRAYADVRGPLAAPDETGVFSERLGAAIEACVRSVTARSRVPDVVLLDSRAGLHDIAAAAITELSDLSLLFAADNAQTWSGYRSLFAQWGVNPGLATTIRERLRMVASLVPDASSAEYLATFRDHSQACFADTLYDDASPDDPYAYNPSPEDSDAPHSPVPILFSAELVSLDASSNRGWHTTDLVAAAYEQFVGEATRLIFGDGP